MRPRLRLLADLLGDIGGAVRNRRRRGRARSELRAGTGAAREERDDVDEIRRRLDETQERLKRGTPPMPP